MPKPPTKVPDQLRITAQESAGVAFEAAEDDGENKVRKFTMTAYTGGLLQLSNFFYPVVVDLQGLKVPAKARPILRDHDPGKIVGHSDNIAVEGRTIRLSGVISAANDFAREVQESSSNGFPWQASIGASIQKMAFEVQIFWQLH